MLVPCGGFLGSRPGVVVLSRPVSWGLYLLCLAGARHAEPPTGGVWQLLVCAILFTAQIMLVNHFSPQLDGIQLSFVQFFVVSVLSTIFAFVFEAPSPDQAAPRRSRLPIAASCPAAASYTRCRSSARRAGPDAIASLAMCLERVQRRRLAIWARRSSATEAVRLRADVRRDCGENQLPEKQ